MPGIEPGAIATTKRLVVQNVHVTGRRRTNQYVNPRIIKTWVSNLQATFLYQR